jgi:hypothetical protein
MNDWKSVKGKIDSNLRLNFDGEGHPHFNGPFSLDKFAWGRISTGEILKGNLDGDFRHLRLSTAKDDFSVDASINDNDDITLNQFKTNFGQDSTIVMRGTLQSRTEKINCSISGHNIPADLWPPLVEHYPEIQGGLDVEGTIFGTLNSPHSNLNMVFHNLKFLNEGEAWNGSGTIFKWTAVIPAI